MKLFSIVGAANIAFLATQAWAADNSVRAGNAAQMATPPGITFKVVRLTQGDNIPGISNVQPKNILIFASGENRPLYTYDKDQPGKSNCTGACAEMWPPAQVASGAEPAGDWSITVRDDGRKQWVYRGQPLYLYAKEDNPTSFTGRGVGIATGIPTGNNIDGQWHIVEVKTHDWPVLPRGLNVAEITTAPGMTLIDSNEKPLYMFNGRPRDKLSSDWQPVLASQLALPLGDFKVIARGDGLYQWALKGKPLFTYAGDVELGDSNGVSADSRFELTFVLRYFMPKEVVVAPDQARGGYFVTAANRQTLYARDRAYTNMEGGHGARGHGRGNPLVAKSIGFSGCDDACEMTWIPFKAPADALPQGHWSVVARKDGSKQWAYQGYPLYTYSKEKPGQTEGNDIYNLTVNDGHSGTAVPNLGFYWRVTSP